jgi:hypothetical protein
VGGVKIKVRLRPAVGGSAHMRRIKFFKSGANHKKKAAPNGTTFILELLARFELATSSLPKVYFRKISSKLWHKFRFLALF